MSGGRWSFAHRQKAAQKTSLVGWLRGESVMSGVDIRLRFWLECSRWKAESDGTDICAVRVDIRRRFWLECSRWKAESDGADICVVRGVNN